ncbi:MAG: hypothetical protein NWE77_02660 [Candidatus Bathyarchaeota archaeon]|jgi:bacterioferritin|nr:hypothetical protein [Candidatus Bathyarchaeota archaeon]
MLPRVNVDSEARQFSERKEASIISSNMHAEVIAARLAYLGGTPTTKPNPIFVGGSVKEMLQTDVKAVCVG